MKRFGNQIYLHYSGFYTNRLPAVEIHRLFKNKGFKLINENFGNGTNYQLRGIKLIRSLTNLAIGISYFYFFFFRDEKYSYILFFNSALPHFKLISIISKLFFIKNLTDWIKFLLSFFLFHILHL